MAEMLAGVCAGTVALVLLAAFAGHLRNPRALPAALAAHRTVPAQLIWPAAVAVATLEGLFGTVTAYAVLAGRAHTLTLGVSGCAVLLAGYALYGLYVLRTRPSVPCGCAADGTPMSGWVAGRAAALALASLVAATGAAPAHGTQTAIAVLASIVFAVLL
ncbi:MAG: methylamine utilization protein MauE, partial [Actinoallomurus sp.]|nr:methylamine utilization protein MauE [Actinoallomurus sp.]